MPTWAPATSTTLTWHPRLVTANGWAARSGAACCRPLPLPPNTRPPAHPHGAQVAYGAGPLVQLLLGCGAQHYMEFKLVQGNHMLESGSGGGGGSGEGDAPVGGGAETTAALRPVPATRAEVFRDRRLGPAQKRALMRFLSAAALALGSGGRLAQAFASDAPFDSLLQSEGLDPQLRSLLLRGVLLQDGPEVGSDDDAGPPLSAAGALALLRLHAGSAGRYGEGTGPFLTPLYGCGELPQAFCRVAAVAGGVQVLRAPLAGLTFDEHTWAVGRLELAGGQVLRCGALAGGAVALAELLATFAPDVCTTVTLRCVAVLDAPLLPDEQQTMLVVPPMAAGGAAVRGLMLGASTAVCPRGRHLLYLWMAGGSAGGGVSGGGGECAAAAVLLPVLAQLADASQLRRQQEQREAAGAPSLAQREQQQAGAPPAAACGGGGGGGGGAGLGEAAAAPRPRVLWAAFFSQEATALQDPAAAAAARRWPCNVALCPGPSASATFASAVEAAKAVYWQLFPGGNTAEEGAGEEGQGREQRQRRHFPLDPALPAVDEEDAASDDEALAALQAALGGLPNGEREE